MITTNQEILDAINYLLYEHEPETPQEIDAYLRSEGLDPEVIADHGRLFASKALAAAQADMGAAQ